MIMQKHIFLLAALAVMASSCGQRTFGGLSFDVEGIGEDRAFIAEMIDSRVKERIGECPGRTFKVVFTIDSTITGENAKVRVCSGKAEIKASRTRGLIFGAGRLLHSMSFSEKGFSIACGNYDFTPKSSSRCCYMARHFNTWYQRAPKAEMLRYIDDMFLWGINTLNTQLGMATVNYDYSTEAERAEFDDVTDAVCRRISQCDMELRTGGGTNVARKGFPSEFKAAPLDPPRGDDSWNVCPSKPGALEYLLANRETALKKYAAKGYPITHMSYFPYDEGGCQCEECAPWGGNGYVKTFTAMHELNQKYFPGVRETVSTWFFDDKDYEGLFKYLETQDWIDYLEIDSHSDFPRYPLEHAIPKNIPVTTFPEISMWGRCPWGGYGATPLPGRFERLFRQVEKIAGGFRLYSEGLYEDINKVVISRIYSDPSLTSADVLEEYARYELPGIDTEEFKEFIGILEANHCTGSPAGERRKDFNFLVFLRDADPDTLALRQTRAARALALAEKMDGELLPSMKNCWRWRQLLLRARIDNEIFTSRKLRTEVADRCYEELVTMYHAEAQKKRLLEHHKDGYTLPPYYPPVQMPAYEDSGIYDNYEDTGV